MRVLLKFRPSFDSQTVIDLLLPSYTDVNADVAAVTATKAAEAVVAKMKVDSVAGAKKKGNDKVEAAKLAAIHGSASEKG